MSSLSLCPAGFFSGSGSLLWGRERGLAGNFKKNSEFGSQFINLSEFMV